MELLRRQFLCLAVGAAAVPVVSWIAWAQAYPSRPIHLIVPYPPGGGTDFFARLVSVSMSQTLGQQVVVENRPGAGTNIGAEFVAHADADGYVFLLGDTATYAANKSLYEKLRYDAERDFAPISLTGRFAIVLLVNTNKLPVGSVTELIAAAKREPGKIDYASGGVGNPFHLASELRWRGLHRRGRRPAARDRDRAADGHPVRHGRDGWPAHLLSPAAAVPGDSGQRRRGLRDDRARDRRGGARHHHEGLPAGDCPPAHTARRPR